MKKVSDIVPEYLEGLHYRIENDIHGRGFWTGIRQFDDLTGGWAEGDLIVLGAHPGMGKTALSTSFILNFLQKQLPVLFVSCEMGYRQVLERLLSQHSGVPLTRITRSQLLPDELNRVKKSASYLQGSPLYVSDTPSSIDKIVEAGEKQGPFSLLVVDYLQIYAGANRTGEVSVVNSTSDTTRALKLAAKVLKCPILIPSQLNRNDTKRKDPRPILTDLRDSQQIAADADMVLMLWREEEVEDELQLFLRKNRHGPIGDLHLKWHKETTLVS